MIVVNVHHLDMPVTVQLNSLILSQHSHSVITRDFHHLLNLYITTSRPPPYLLPFQYQQPQPTHPSITTINDKISNSQTLETIGNLLTSSASEYLLLTITLLLLVVINDITAQAKTLRTVQAWDQKQQERKDRIDLSNCSVRTTNPPRKILEKPSFDMLTSNHA
jgi:hypothetical protein